MRAALISASAVLLFATNASSQPGLGSKVYGSDVHKGEFELETRAGALQGGRTDGTAALVLEAAYGFTDRFQAGLLTEFQREPGGGFESEASGVEAIYEVGALPGGVGLALYGEYEAVRDGNNALELKALLQKRVGRFDGRLNLIAERDLGNEGETEFGYAASADWEVAHDVRLGLQGFGDVGDDERFGGRREHYVGPVAKFEFDALPFPGELQIETGYLFAAGSARDEADGQFRLLLEFEREF